MNSKSKAVPEKGYTPNKKKRLSNALGFGVVLPIVLLIGIGCFFIWDFTVINNNGVYDKNYYLMRQIIFAAAGMLCMYFVSKIDYHSLEIMLIPGVIGIALANLCYHLSDNLGVVQAGDQYLRIGPVVFHVGTLTELIAGVVIAKMLVMRVAPIKKSLVIGMFIIFVSAMFFMLPDYISITIFLCVVMVMFFVSSKHFGYFIVISALVIALMASVIVVSGDGTNHRIFAWMDPFSDPNGAGFYIIQSLYSIAEGGFWGVGVGNGTLRHSVGNAHSFLIFPAIIQETGLLGAGIILILFLLFLIHAIKIAVCATDKWGFYLATVITVRFALMLIFNLLMHTNMLPTAHSLRFPFLSYGGTALMLDCWLVGILLSVARYRYESGRR